MTEREEDSLNRGSSSGDLTWSLIIAALVSIGVVVALNFAYQALSVLKVIAVALLLAVVLRTAVTGLESLGGLHPGNPAVGSGGEACGRRGVMGRQIQVPPAMILVSILLLGTLLGPIIGTLLAIPTAVVVVTLVDELTTKEDQPEGARTAEDAADANVRDRKQ